MIVADGFKTDKTRTTTYIGLEAFYFPETPYMKKGNASENQETGGQKMDSFETHGEASFPYTAAVSGQYTAHPYGVGGTVSHVSNPVVVHVIHVVATKTVTPACARRGEFVTYTIVICNESDLPIHQVKIIDQDTAEWFEIPDIRLDGRSVPEGDLKKGIFIGTLPPGGRSVVTFDALARESVPPTLISAAEVSYEYEGEIGRSEGSVLSNPAELVIIRPGVHIWKTADREVLTADDHPVRYHLRVENTGNVPLANVVVTDTLPPQMEYLPGSTQIDNGSSAHIDPMNGIFLGTLEIEQTVEIQFYARVKGSPK